MFLESLFASKNKNIFKIYLPPILRPQSPFLGQVKPVFHKPVYTAGGGIFGRKNASPIMAESVLTKLT